MVSVFPHDRLGLLFYQSMSERDRVCPRPVNKVLELHFKGSQRETRDDLQLQIPLEAPLVFKVVGRKDLL